MLSTSDKEKLISAQQAVDLARQAVSALYQAEDQLLAEHAYDLLDPLAKIDMKLQRLITVEKP
jgi:hypothetical protein